MQRAKGLFLDKKKEALSQIQVCNAQCVSTKANAAPMRLTRHPSRLTGRQTINTTIAGTRPDALRTFVLLALLQLKLYNAFEICAYCSKHFFLCLANYLSYQYHLCRALRQVV